jgi:hypothetical protein
MFQAVRRISQRQTLRILRSLGRDKSQDGAHGVEVRAEVRRRIQVQLLNHLQRERVRLQNVRLGLHVDIGGQRVVRHPGAAEHIVKVQVIRGSALNLQLGGGGIAPCRKQAIQDARKKDEAHDPENKPSASVKYVPHIAHRKLAR